MDDTDAGFATLRAWKDANSNVVTDAGELLTLAQGGVKSLKVGYTDAGPSAPADAQGNTHQQVGSFTTTTGATRGMDDVWFASTGWDTVDQRPTVVVSEEIEALPDLAGSGTLSSLHQVARDSSFRLRF